ncbi:GspH/FimT family pseudopilin [Rhodanobacter sp. DHG33]|uniref:GspH/FimT family pseudopilin n=1 Tax=Rhodanobacter sp. DHG33 TaxID=2775921 RepID=UPI00177EFDE2|nr:GspH/FimT family pseudopilin [Rhodanobacter sp. DHG33]MBD8898103.1 GspH/FimT family pseudopilin [Rhodanobacter sp. DHG33]
MTHVWKKNQGFTLIELMVTLVILAVLTMIALPSFRDTIRRSQVSASSNALLADISYARSEAIDRGQVVTMCPSTTGSACTTSGTTWGTGWMVYSYPAGAASTNAAYTTGNLQLRVTTQQNNMSIWAAQTTYPSFGQQGQLLPSSSTLRFVTCYTDSSGNTVNTATVPGVELDVNGSGTVTSKPLATGASCSS